MPSIHFPRSNFSLAAPPHGASMPDSPFASSAPYPNEIPVHDMKSLGRYAPRLAVYESGEIVGWKNAYPGTIPYKTNVKLADGDIVVLIEHAEVNGYWYDPVYTGCGQWVNHVVLAGSVGTVVTARTPWVHAPEGAQRYFANVDIEMPDGTLSRVRVAHTALKRVRKPLFAAMLT